MSYGGTDVAAPINVSSHKTNDCGSELDGTDCEHLLYEWLILDIDFFLLKYLRTRQSKPICK